MSYKYTSFTGFFPPTPTEFGSVPSSASKFDFKTDARTNALPFFIFRSSPNDGSRERNVSDRCLRNRRPSRIFRSKTRTNRFALNGNTRPPGSRRLSSTLVRSDGNDHTFRRPSCTCLNRELAFISAWRVITHQFQTNRSCGSFAFCAIEN